MASRLPPQDDVKTAPDLEDVDLTVEHKTKERVANDDDEPSTLLKEAKLLLAIFIGLVVLACLTASKVSTISLAECLSDARFNRSGEVQLPTIPAVTIPNNVTVPPVTLPSTSRPIRIFDPCDDESPEPIVNMLLFKC
ncbi:Hypp8193 [Branchiostoma lanceolatum]|uniref:Hypp8193 protein n=1 Tax=Branchiostoma lanceolatum TaxID=7740 RepID=A0A8J9Z7P6_BRALA|nr:Hypp8193 [Branchiostoma lanceolatum]